MGQVCDLIGTEGATAAGVLRPPEHPGFEERPIDDQLPAALEQIEQTHSAPGRFEYVGLLDRHPRHPAALGRQSVTGPRQRLLLYEHLLARSLPVLRRDDWRGIHSGLFAAPVLVKCLGRGHAGLLWLFIHRSLMSASDRYSGMY